MRTHEMTSFVVGEDKRRCYLEARIRGYEPWSVAAEATLRASSVPEIAVISIYPRQHFGTNGAGDRLVWKPGDAPGQESPRAWEDEERRPQWSGAPNDVPIGGIPTRLLRAISPLELLEMIRQALSERGAQDLDNAAPEVPSALEQALKMSAELSSSSALGKATSRYLYYASQYAELVRAGDRRPVSTLAVTHGHKEPYVRNTIHNARRLGLLTASARGRAGGELTPKALELLRGTEEAQVTQAEEPKPIGPEELLIENELLKKVKF